MDDNGSCAAPVVIEKDDCGTGFFQNSDGVIGLAIDGILRAEFHGKLDGTIVDMVNKYRCADILRKYKGDGWWNRMADNAGEDDRG